MTTTPPSGASPGASPASAGPVQRSPSTGEQSAPVVCEHCRNGHPRIGSDHWLVCERGVKLLGPCATPPAIEVRRQEAAPRRTDAECRARLAAYKAEAMAGKALHEARETYATHSEPQDREDTEA